MDKKTEEKKGIEMLFEDSTLSELSEDFKSKATIIFENAVALQVSDEKKKLEEDYNTKLEEQQKKVEENLEEKVDSYLTYVAEEWMKDNELAIENGIQVEIAENFFKGMKDLFTESYVEIPEGKVNIVAEITDELSKKSDSLDEAIDANIELKKEIVEMKKDQIVSDFTINFADTQAEKLNDLVEMIDYEDEEQFTSRVESIVETYFSKYLTEEEKEEIAKKKKENGDDKDDDDKDDDDKDKDDKDKDKDKKVEESMKRYVEALSQSVL